VSANEVTISLSKSRGVSPYAFLIPFLQIRQAGSARSNVHVVLVLFDESICQIFSSTDIGVF